MFNRILVPLDGLAVAAGVLPHVVALAQALGSNLTLLRVLEGQAAPGGAMNPVEWQLVKAEAHAYLNTLAAHMDEQMDDHPICNCWTAPPPGDHQPRPEWGI